MKKDRKGRKLDLLVVGKRKRSNSVTSEVPLVKQFRLDMTCQCSKNVVSQRRRDVSGSANSRPGWIKRVSRCDMSMSS